MNCFSHQKMFSFPTLINISIMEISSLFFRKYKKNCFFNQLCLILNIYAHATNEIQICLQFYNLFKPTHNQSITLFLVGKVFEEATIERTRTFDMETKLFFKTLIRWYSLRARDHLRTLARKKNQRSDLMHYEKILQSFKDENGMKMTRNIFKNWKQMCVRYLLQYFTSIFLIISKLIQAHWIDFLMLCLETD
jgi:hypothetical protein